MKLRHQNELGLLAKTNHGALVLALCAKKAKGIVSKTFFPPCLKRESVRCGQKASRLGAILRLLAVLQILRQRLNQWDWRKKTALVTALAITATGTFVYQYKANAAWPAIIAASYGTDFFVKLFTGYAITQGLNAAFNRAVLKETAAADTDEWLYSKRKYYRRDYSYTDNGATTTTDVSIDAQAEANQLKAYDASGTDSRFTPSTLDADDVLDYYVNHNTHIRRAITEEYQILNDGEPLYQWDVRWGYSRRTLQTFAIHLWRLRPETHC